MGWPLALMVTVAMIVIGVVAVLERDVTAVSSAILTVLVALGIAELREIRTISNGNTLTLQEHNKDLSANVQEQNRALLEELAQYRRDANRFTERALVSPPIQVLPPEEVNIPDGRI